MANPEPLQALRQGVEAWHQEQDQRWTQALRDLYVLIQRIKQTAANLANTVLPSVIWWCW
jgi:hypothetical protein